MRRATRLAAVAGLAALPLLAAATPASADLPQCVGHNFGAKFDGLWGAVCVDPGSDEPVDVRCGSYTMRCA